MISTKGRLLFTTLVVVLILVSVSPVPTNAASSYVYDSDTITYGGASITVSVKGYYIYGQYEFYKVVHFLQIVMPFGFSWNGAGYCYGEGCIGLSYYEVYHEWLFYAGSYTYNSDPHVDHLAYTDFYGYIFFFGFPVALADLHAQVWAEGPFPPP